MQLPGVLPWGNPPCLECRFVAAGAPRFRLPLPGAADVKEHFDLGVAA